ncbi:MAG: division/cell wall cluster transcriptional repressor MraZ [Clostridia bacterium]|nr:division/cell wall cluster transcriptional repressor MraZ [Clostridia bacterium]
MARVRIFGEYRHNIDAKKRLALPSKIRDCMSETMILVSSLFAPCIALYPMEEWEKFEERLDGLSQTDGVEARREIYSKMAEVQCDAQGRILIPQNLCEIAGLERNVVIAGAGAYAEIWDAGRWDEDHRIDKKPIILEKLDKANF